EGAVRTFGATWAWGVAEAVSPAASFGADDDVVDADSLAAPPAELVTLGALPLLPVREVKNTTATIQASPDALARLAGTPNRDCFRRGKRSAASAPSRPANSALGRGVSALRAISSSCSSVVITSLPELLECTVKSGARVGFGDAQHLRDLRVGQLAGELERHD